MMYKYIVCVRYFSFMVGENICSWYPVIRDGADNIRPINWEQKFIWSSIYVEAFKLSYGVCLFKFFSAPSIRVISSHGKFFTQIGFFLLRNTLLCNVCVDYSCLWRRFWNKENLIFGVRICHRNKPQSELIWTESLAVMEW